MPAQKNRSRWADFLTGRFFWLYAGVFLVMLPFLSLAEESESGKIFTDLTTEHRYSEAIQYLKDRYIVEGYPDGSFKSNREINRAEALKIIMLGANYHLSEMVLDEGATPEADHLYPDVPDTEWYFPYISKATEIGIVNGYPDGTFHPENTVNLAETLKMIIEANEAEVPAEEEIEGRPYFDIAKDAWYIGYAQFFKDYYLTEADETGNLNAGQDISRGYLCELIYRFIKREEFQAKGLVDEDAKRYIYTYATFYGGGDGFHGRTTANGETFDDQQFTAAHRELPFDTWIRVISTENEELEVTVRINDRGPYHPRATIDLSAAAFEEMYSISRGIIPVKYEIVEEP